MSDTIIEAKFLEFVNKDSMFTSVDIANAIKKDGNWVRNSEVAKWLRSNALSVAPNYLAAKINVANNQHRASLYYPSMNNPDDYKDRDQVALPPPHASVPVQTQPAVVSTGIRKFRVRCDQRARLRIPSQLVMLLGWFAGHKVDKTKILVNNQDIADDLVVHQDGRIYIPRKCVALGDGPVLVFVDKGKLCFEKP